MGVPVHSLVVGRQGTEGSNSVVPGQTSGVHNRDVAKNPYNRPTSNKCYPPTLEECWIYLLSIVMLWKFDSTFNKGNY